MTTSWIIEQSAHKTQWPSSAQQALRDLSTMREESADHARKLRTMPALDELDARLLMALTATPRATTSALAHTTGAARNTVQSRLERLDAHQVLRSFAHRIEPESLGYGLTAFIMITVRQQHLDEVGRSLEEIAEVLEVFGLSGPIDLLARVVAKDGDDLYRVVGQILATRGVDRTECALTIRRMVDFRVEPLLLRVADADR